MDSFIPWLADAATSLRDLRARGKLPHALLVHGAPGTGRAALAVWLAREVLHTSQAAAMPGLADAAGLSVEAVASHPDLFLVQPPPDKRSIPIDRVREMVSFLQLTSHQSGGKVAIVSPAEGLTRQAANSLLKTLEEPPAGTLIVLLAAAPGSLPATVISRCQRLRIPLPPRPVALDWLATQGPGADWAGALDLAGGAPLRALALRSNGFLEEVQRLERDLEELGRRAASPVSVGRRWARLPSDLCLDWLYRRAAEEIRTRLEHRKAPVLPLQNGKETLNMDALFTYLRELAELRRLQGAGLNAEMNFAQLLGPWYGGLGT